MVKKVTIQIGELQFRANIYDTPTGNDIAESLPLEGSAQVWGEEVYFYFDVELPLESDSRDVLEIGELGYWPSGPAFCIFYGPTPMSQDKEPRAASNVNVFGMIEGDITLLKQVQNGEKIVVK